MLADVKIDIPENEQRDKKQKNLARFGIFAKHVEDFMESSSIHGLKYLVGSNRSFLEKILWFTVLLVSIYTCSLFIRSTWQKWEENPTFIGFAQAPVRLWEIPFPAVTICPGYTLNRKSNHTFKYTIDGKKWDVGNASTYCAQADVNSENSCTEFECQDYFEEEKWENYMTKVPLLLEHFLMGANLNWKDVKLSPLWTSFGLCYSFNMLDKKDLLHSVTHLPSALLNQDNISYWTFDNNYQNTYENVYPHRLRTIDDNFLLRLNSNLDKVGCYGFDTYFMKLHHPGAIPLMHKLIEIEPKKIYNVWITPDITVTAQRLKTYSPLRKKCFFSDEGHLRFYKIYTQENCMLECRANYTLRICGCVPSFLPHNKTTISCGLWNEKNLVCIFRSEKLMHELESGLIKNNSNLPLCNCLPSCNSIIYTSEVTVKDSSTNSTYVIIRFKEAEFNVLERQELFGDVDFWASCGGILGLFIGFSVVSLAEIIYYLFVQWFFSIGRRLLESASKSK